MNEPVPQPPIIHILKHGRSYCNMPGVPGSWPDNHLHISFEDTENASQANCQDCLLKRDHDHLADRLNAGNVQVLRGVLVAGILPRGVDLVNHAGDAMEESTGQAANFDPDLCRWAKLG